jgi:NAD(P)-dependent dehydrogenase (short-subunit alcohol dehydrogenase family)
MKRLAGKSALVTGSGTGIGREVGLEFARRGADVVFHYSRSDRGALSAVEEARSEGVRAEAYQADFGDVEQVRSLGESALQFLGGLDILVNNAGISMNLPFEKISVEQWDTLYHVNVRAQFFLTQVVLPALLESKGVILNMTSIHAYQGHPEFTVYSGTKAAIIAYTRDLAIALAPRGVRVNALAPGATEVESHHELIPDYDRDAIGANIPCGFVGQPSDIANAAVFLVSDDARYIVAQTIVVDGGISSWMPVGCDSFKRPLSITQGKGYVPGL